VEAFKIVIRRIKKDPYLIRMKCLAGADFTRFLNYVNCALNCALGSGLRRKKLLKTAKGKNNQQRKGFYLSRVKRD